MLHSIWTACTLHLSYHYCLQDSVYQHCENSLDLFSVLDPLLFFTSCLPLSWFSPILCMSGQLLFTRAFHSRVIWTYYYGLSEPYQYVLSEPIPYWCDSHIQYIPPTPLTSSQRSLPVFWAQEVKGLGTHCLCRLSLAFNLVPYSYFQLLQKDLLLIKNLSSPTVCQVICWVL